MRSTLFVWVGRHFDVDDRSLHQFFVAQPVFGVIHTVEFHVVDIPVGGVVGGGVDDYLFTVFEVDGRFFEQGRSHDIFVAARTDGVKAKGGEDVPGRCLAIVFVAAIAVSGVGR